MIPDPEEASTFLAHLEHITLKMLDAGNEARETRAEGAKAGAGA